MKKNKPKFLLYTIFYKLKNNELVFTSFFSSIGTAVGFISGFVVNKIVAIFLGPAGVAMTSQFQNFISISTVIGSGGIQQGVVKYLAEVKDDFYQKSRLISTSLKLTILLSCFGGFVIILFSRSFSVNLFNNSSNQFVIIIFGITLILFSLNNLVVSILNGFGEIKKMTLVNITSNLFSLLITASSAYFFNIKGVLFSLAISQAIVFFVTILLTYQSPWFKKKNFFQNFDKEFLIKLSKFSVMSFFSLILFPLIQISIRKYIIASESIETAGMWDGINKISSAYLGLMTTTLSIYFLPKLSMIKERLKIREEILRGYKLILPILITTILIIYYFRNNIILILYSKLFLKIENLFLPQLLGDFFKITSWLLAYLMLAKAKTRLFVYSQIFFSTSLYFLSVYLFDLLGIVGVTWAYCLNSIIYLIFNLIIFRKYLIK